MKRVGIAVALIFALSSALIAQDKPVAKSEKAPGQLEVTEAKLGTDVQAKKLVGEAAEFALNQKVYLWLAVSGGPADDLTVTWKHADKTYETKLKVGGPTFHTWAYKTAALVGAWSVSITDASGKALKELQFTVSDKK